RPQGGALARAKGGDRPRVCGLSRDERRRVCSQQFVSMAGLSKEEFRSKGHTTVAGVFGAAEMDAVVEDIGRWGEQFLADLAPEQRRWYLDGGVKAREVLRKLDNPHFHRASIERLARDARLVGLVEQLIGK